MRLKGYFGIQIADLRTVGAIVNMDATHVPTAAQIDDLIAMVHGQSNNTYLFMHPKTHNLIKQYKEGVLTLDAKDTSYSRAISDWSGVRMIPSYNLHFNAESYV